MRKHPAVGGEGTGRTAVHPDGPGFGSTTWGLAPSVALDAEGLPPSPTTGSRRSWKRERSHRASRGLAVPYDRGRRRRRRGVAREPQPRPDPESRRDRAAEGHAERVPVPFEPRRTLACGSDEGAGRRDRRRDRGKRCPRRLDHGPRRRVRIGPTPFEIGAVEETPEAGAPPPSWSTDPAHRSSRTRSPGPSRRSGWPSGSARTGGSPRWPRSPVRRGMPAGNADVLLDGEPLLVTADPFRRGDRGVAAGGSLEDRSGGHRRHGRRVGLHRGRHGRDRVLHGDGGWRSLTGRPGSWSVEEVARSRRAMEAEPTDVPTAPGTGSRVDQEGTVWVARQDGEGIHLASLAEGAVEEVEPPTPPAG